MFERRKYRIVAFAILSGIIGILAFFVLLPFWQALAWGVAFAIIVFPVHMRLRRRMSNVTSALLTTIIALLLLAIPLGGMSIAVFGETQKIYRGIKAEGSGNQEGIQLSAWINKAQDSIAPALAELGIRDFDLRETLQHTLEPVVSSAPKAFANIIHIFLVFFFAIMVLFFILKDAHILYEPALSIIPLSQEKSEALLISIYKTVHATFYGVVLIAIINGLLIGGLFWFMGVKAPVLWGIVAIILSILPFAGAPMLYLPSAILFAMSDQWTQAVIIALFGFLVVTLAVDKFYRSVLVSQHSNLHPMGVLFSLLGGAFAFGAVGMFLGPVVLIIALKLLEVVRELPIDQEPEVTPVN